MPLEAFDANHSAQLLVMDLFYISSRGWVITGEIGSGEIKPGMFINIPMTSSSITTFEIHSIEFLPNQNVRKPVGLLHRCDGKHEFEMLKRLGLVGKTLNITLEGSD
jgi:translation elongation factor EF-Tu-like GTPase